MSQKLTLAGLNVGLRLSENTKHSCAFFTAHVNKVSTCIHIAIPGKLSINVDALLYKNLKGNSPGKGLFLPSDSLLVTVMTLD